MKKRIFSISLFLFLVFLISLVWYNNKTDDSCPSDPLEVWHNCFGSRYAIKEFVEVDLEIPEILKGVNDKCEETDQPGPYYLFLSNSYLPSLNGSEKDAWLLDGYWENNMMNGQGAATAANGSKYVGEYKDDQRHGQGTYTWPDGDKYVGEFKYDVPNGVGISTWDNGHKYEGEHKDGLFHGQGTYTWSYGEKHVGNFKDDAAHGQGTRTIPNGDKYVGEFKYWNPNGRGTYTWSNGDKYVGELKDGVRHGQGTMTYANGQTQIGEWEYDKYVYSIHNSPQAKPFKQ